MILTYTEIHNLPLEAEELLRLGGFRHRLAPCVLRY